MTDTYPVLTLVPFLIILIGSMITVIIDPYINRKNRKMMLLIVSLTVCIFLKCVSEKTSTAKQ